MKKNRVNKIKKENKNLIKYYNSSLIKEEYISISSSKKKGFILSVPMFNRKVIIFKLGGHFIKKHYRKESINQTVTIECMLAKNKIIFTIPVHSSGLQIL